MGKVIMFLIFIGLAILLVGGIVSPATPAMWLASSSHAFMYLRIGLMTLLGLLLVTNPPRNIYFRTFVGLAAVIMSAWSLGSTYNNHMQLLDSLSILGASVTMGIVALEYTPDEVDVPKLAAKQQKAKPQHLKKAATTA